VTEALEASLSPSPLHKRGGWQRAGATRWHRRAQSQSCVRRARAFQSTLYKWTVCVALPSSPVRRLHLSCRDATRLCRGYEFPSD